MYKRDYLGWHNIKETINDTDHELFFREREVWWCSLGANIGSEQDGTGAKFLRPIIVFKKFNTHVFWGIPTTTKPKESGLQIPVNTQSNQKQSYAIISQLKLLDRKRLVDKIGHISKKDYSDIQKAIIKIVSL